MAIGSGKYDEICTLARNVARARGAIVIIVDGCRGSGFSSQLDAELTKKIPDILEDMAKQIRADMAAIH